MTLGPEAWVTARMVPKSRSWVNTMYPFSRAHAVSRGVAAAGYDTGKPVIFGVLTTDTIEQAIERAGTKAGNKGADAALAAIEMVNLLERL